MSNKPTWIKVHSNILEPKHQRAIGERIWLFLYLIDKANWDTGVVLEYTDADAAQALGRSKRTIERWRQGLAESGYITCQQIQRGQDVTIHNWRNPKHVNSEPINKRTKEPTTKMRTPKKVQGTQQGTQQGRQIRVPSQVQTEHATHIHITHKDSAADAAKADRAKLFEAVLLHAFKITYVPNMDLPKSVQGRVGRIVKALVDVNATADEYAAYATAWKSEHPHLTPVQSETKLPMEILAYREKRQQPASTVPTARRLDNPYGETPILSIEDRQRIAQQLKEQRNGRKSA